MRSLLVSIFLILASSMTSEAQTLNSDNQDMIAIFNADQSIRQEFSADKLNDTEFMRRMIDGDKNRRARTAELLSSDQLKTGNDFYRAAFIFQHGGSPEDYLMAHTLSILALKEGHKGATWIAAATLDRYLMKIDRSQIYGTQYTFSDTGEPSMSPYNEDLIPDTLREALGVPKLTEQKKKLEERLNAN